MINKLSTVILAAGLAAGLALSAAPSAEARSIQRDGYFGGTWSPIGPRNNQYVRRYHRRHGPTYYAYGPEYYAYGSRFYARPGYAPGYLYGPGYYYGPGLSLGLTF